MVKKEALVRDVSIEEARYGKERIKTKEKEFEVKAPNKKTGLNTKLTQLETLELYNKGFKIDEIAVMREIKKETVMNHLCFLVEKKILPIKEVDKLVPENIQRKIRQAVGKVGVDKLKPIFEELGEVVSYDEIKLVLAKIKAF
jgi:ATP-dependent DNA helicase RecQ